MRSYVVEPDYFVVLQTAYNDACNDVGIDPHETGPEAERAAREALAKAVLSAGKHNETSPRRLKIMALSQCCNDTEFTDAWPLRSR